MLLREVHGRGNMASANMKAFQETLQSLQGKIPVHLKNGGCDTAALRSAGDARCFCWASRRRAIERRFGPGFAGDLRRLRARLLLQREGGGSGRRARDLARPRVA